MKLVIGGVAQGKLDYVLENMIEKTEIRHQTWNGHGILASMMRVYL